MKLECEDVNNGSISVATICDINGDQVCIHFDGWDNDHDFWTFPWDPLLRPVGWCCENEKIICAPKGECSTATTKSSLTIASCFSVDKFYNQHRGSKGCHYLNLLR